MIAGTKIDGACTNHPRSTRTRHPAPAYRSGPRRVEGSESTGYLPEVFNSGLPPTDESGSKPIKRRAPPDVRRVSSLRCRPRRRAKLVVAVPQIADRSAVAVSMPTDCSGRWPIISRRSFAAWIVSQRIGHGLRIASAATVALPP